MRLRDESEHTRITPLTSNILISIGLSSNHVARKCIDPVPGIAATANWFDLGSLP